MAFQVLSDARFLWDDKWHSNQPLDEEREEVNNGTTWQTKDSLWCIVWTENKATGACVYLRECICEENWWLEKVSLSLCGCQTPAGVFWLFWSTTSVKWLPEWRQCIWAGIKKKNRINKYIKEIPPPQSGNVTLMQQEKADGKAIKAKRGPGVHSSFYTPTPSCTVWIPTTFPAMQHTHTRTPSHPHTHTLSASCSSSVPSELFFSAELSSLKESVHLNVHNLLSEAHSWSHGSPVALQRNSLQETDMEKRFYLGRIQWPVQKNRGEKAKHSEKFRYTGHLFPWDFNANTCFYLLLPPDSFTGKTRQKTQCWTYSLSKVKKVNTFWQC